MKKSSALFAHALHLFCGSFSSLATEDPTLVRLKLSDELREVPGVFR